MTVKNPHKPTHHRWELISCGWHGHETYEPTGSEQAKTLAASLQASTNQGVAWRCLRCGNYILGKPRRRGKVENAPIVLRGKALRSAIIIRTLALERLIRGTFLVLIGYAILRFKAHEGALSDLFNNSLPALHQVANNVGYNLDTSETLHVIRNVLGANQHTLNLFAGGAFVYAGLQLIEGTGLWLMKRWGEYFAVVATSLFIPLEIYEIYHHSTFLKISAFIVNVIAVVYLVYSKRLFGVRGGTTAYEAELHTEKLIELQTES